MYDIENLPDAIDIGYTGEKDFRTVEVDMTRWLEDMYDGTPAIVFKRPGVAAYKPVTTFTDGILTWTVQDTDLGTSEVLGFAQFEMKDTDRARKSPIIKVWIHRGLTR